MISIWQILFPPRCGKCLSKVYCDEFCKKQDWDAGHHKYCSEPVDERKVKHTGKERRKAGRDQLKGTFENYKEGNRERLGRERIKEVKEMCKEMGRSKKASGGAAKAKAVSKKDDPQF